VVKLALTEEEKQAIIVELAQRMKDLVYMNAEEKAEEIIDKILKSNPHPHTKFRINYTFEFMLNDIIQIVGRIRRDE